MCLKFQCQWRIQGGGPRGEVPGGRSPEEGPRGSRTSLFFLSDTKILTTTTLQITSQYEEFQIHRSWNIFQLI